MSQKTKTARVPANGLHVSTFIPAGVPMPTEVHLITEIAGGQIIIAFKTADVLMDTMLHLMEADTQVWPALAKMWAEIE